MEILNNKSKVEKIYHIGDVHVMKNNNRDEEYREVFEDLYESIKKDTKNALIVCTGDVFNDGLSPSSIILVKNLFSKLSELCDIVIFRGNHDQTSRSNSETIDFLFPVLYKLESKNKIHVLGKTGSYIYGNLIFGYTDVYESVVYKIDGHNDKIKIGLWHGTINGSKIDNNNNELDGKFNQGDFKGYDYVFLGDIHKFQYLNKDKTIAYCGSTLQLNFGENILGHGYLKWDLVKKTSEHVHIKNNYGFLTLRAKNNKLEKYDKTIVPKNINLRIIYENCETEFIAKIYDDISKDHKIMSYQQEKRDSEIIFTKDKEDNKEILDEKSCIKNLINYIKKNNFDKDKDKNSDEEKVEKEKDNEINEIETIISEKIKEIDYKYNSEKRNIKLKSLCFNNFNVYGQDNYIDYSALKGIVNVSGQNGIGKSSLIHCILYSIYGLCEELSGKYDYINTKERELETLIILDINGVEYKIFRECKFGDVKRTEKNVTNNVIIYENGKDISGKSLPEINKQIFTIVGNPDNLKNICIMEQKRNESFLNLKDTEKTEYLFKILKLDIYNELCDSISSEVKLNNRIISSNNEKIYTDAKKKTGSKDKIIEDEIKVLKEANEELLQKEKILNEKYNSIHKEKIENELKYDELKEFEDMEDSEKNRSELEKKKEKNNKEIKNQKDELEEDNDKLSKNKKELEKYKNIETKNREFEEKKKKEIKNINDEINKLFEGYVKTEKKEGNIDKLKEEKSKLKKDKKVFKEQRESLEEEIEELENDITKYENTKEKEEGYNKYLEWIQILEEISEKRKITKMRTDELISKQNKKDKEYKKNNKMLEDLEKKCNIIKIKIDKYGDMKEKKKIYEKEREDEINKLNDEIQKDLECYTKVNINEKIDCKKCNSKLEELEKEKESIIKKQKEINEKIIDNKSKITEIKDSKKIINNYNDFVSIDEKKQKEEFELETLHKKFNEYLNHLEMIKSHEYNKDCKICMKNKLTQDLINTENAIQTVQDKIKKSEKELKKILSDYKKSEKYKGEYEEYENNLKINEELNKTINEEKNKKMLMDEKLKNIIKDIGINKSLLDEYDKKQSLIKNNEIIDKRLKENRKLLDEIKNKKYDEYDEYYELFEEKMELDREIEEIKKNTIEHEKILKEINDMNDIMEKYVDEEERINKKYDKYVKFGKLYEENIKNIELLEKKRNELEMNNKNYEIISNKIENLNNKIEEYEKYLEIEEENKKVLIKINEKKGELKELEIKKYDDYENYIILVDTNNKLSSHIMENKLKLQNLESVSEKIKRDLEAIIEIIKKIEVFKNIKAKCEKANIEYKNISKEMEEFIKEKNKIMTKIIELTNDSKNIKLLIEENKKLKKEYNLKSKIIEIIKDGYIDNLLTNNIIPELSTSVNNILESFVNYKIHMEYNNKKITVYKKDKDGMLSNASKLSGYETLMANISFRLAMNNKNKLQKTNFFIIDEGFAFCDDQSIPKISNLFAYMRQIYDFVIIISHDEQIKMYTDMNLQIKHKDGYSYARFSNEKNIDIMNKNIELMNLRSSKKKAKEFKIKKEFNNDEENNTTEKTKIKKLVKVDKSKKN
jgi:DNA repair exonuclease SbcCD ATPase subunit/DNA repair exonuclease SbcCD nuclease subunit